MLSSIYGFKLLFLVEFMGLNWILWFPNSTRTKMQTYPIYGFKLDSNQNSSTLNSKIKRIFFFIESGKKKVKMSVEIEEHMGRWRRKKMIQLFVFLWNTITFRPCFFFWKTFRPCLVCLRFWEKKFNNFLYLVCTRTLINFRRERKILAKMNIPSPQKD